MEARDDDMNDTPDLETREERSAAAEAASIGGPEPEVRGAGDEPIDQALRPVYEAGGGEQEGFELAERDLIHNASHDDGEAYPERDAFTPETESDRSPAEYGEADQETRSDD